MDNFEQDAVREDEAIVQNQPVEPDAVPPVVPKRSAFKELMSWVIPFACALLLALALRTYVFELISVDGPSMLDTLTTGEVVYINKIASWTHTLRRGDVVLCHFPDKQKNYIKRLIALPGDTVQLASGMLMINGEVVEEPYLTPERVREEDFGPITVDEGYAMVFGDNRSNSSDSRSLGQIALKSVLGRGVRVIWPLDNARKLDNTRHQP